MKRAIFMCILIAGMALPAISQESKPAAKNQDANEKLMNQYQQEIQDLHSIIKQYDAQIRQLKEQIAQLNQQIATLTKSPDDSASAQTDNAVAPAAAAAAQSYWVNLLDMVNLSRDVTAGQWNLNANGLSGNSPQGGMGMIILPVIPTGNYDMTFEFCRTSGSAEIQLDLPVGPRSLRIVLSRPNGWTEDLQYQKYAAGIEYINGMGVLQNQMFSSNNFILTNGQNHYLHVRIREDGKKAAVDVFYDDTELVDWSGELSSLSMFPDANAQQARKFGLSISAGTMIQIFEARVKMFEKPASPVEPAAPAARVSPVAPAAGGK
ncbi:MAG TPA: hypothetical protein PKK48_04775 [Phycisphaerae bacterium]|nr:hypothetical protein [Phycisphaerae bacterium]HPS52969.1 hypothetical protein [Phycisphaerae bacterium]